ncbi:MAG: GNAT family N-acetyltransferase [Oscillospiraceae bacterium]|nr:GNAT family N-acetyltransferase [Oscillospiraceae bacterium]MBQ3561357.1 GNAT family N-acetyltransferase [Oscillospiraceae bacterium]MBQ4118496.1 GNAT family N-acetyltransferase [Oscillospiraceae bacterium]
MEVGFEFVKESEAHLLSEFRQKVWATTYRGIYPDEIIDNFDFDFHDKRNLLWIKSEDFLVYFISADGEKAGYLILQKKDPFYVQSLYLLPEFRGKGIGKKVFEFIRVFCKEHGKTHFYLGCHPQNKKALGFYAAMGGTITARDENHENNRENNVKIEFDV